MDVAVVAKEILKTAYESGIGVALDKDLVWALNRHIENLEAHRCEVGMEDPEESMKALMALPPEDLAAINQLFNAKQTPPDWTPTCPHLPDIKTPVLIVINGKIRIGELCEEYVNPYRSSSYWDDPYNAGQDWAWDAVTHWRPFPKLPSE